MDIAIKSTLSVGPANINVNLIEIDELTSLTDFTTHSESASITVIALVDSYEILHKNYHPKYMVVPIKSFDSAYMLFTSVILNLNKTAIGVITLDDEEFTCAIHCDSDGILVTAISNYEFFQKPLRYSQLKERQISLFEKTF